MADQARVDSIEALKTFRAALAEFADGARNALAGVEIELRRARDWLEHEQPRYWKHQIKVWDQRMNEARAALHRKNLQRTEGFVPDVSQEKEALRVCKQRIDEAERTLNTIRRWGPQLQQATSEYQGRARPLADAASIDIERMMAMLERMIGSLEAYVGAAPPRSSSAPAASPSPDPGPAAGPEST